MRPTIWIVAGFALSLPASSVAQVGEPGETEIEAPQIADIDWDAVTTVSPGSMQELVGMPVFGADGEQVGEVSEIVSVPGGETEAVKVAIGGFLGLGAKTVLLPADKIRVPDDLSARQSGVVYLPDVSAREGPHTPMNGGGGPGVGGGKPGPMPRPKPGHVQVTAEEVLPEDLIGEMILSTDGERLGEIEYVTIDESGNVESVMVGEDSVGGGPGPVRIPGYGLGILRAEDGGGIEVYGAGAEAH